MNTYNDWIMYRLAPLLLIVMLGFTALVCQAGEEHDQHEHATSTATLSEPEQAPHQHTEDGIHLSSKQLAMANIGVEKVQPRVVSWSLYAPGEVVSDQYRTVFVSARIPSVVVARHVQLGQHLQPGAAVATLFSTDMANAQSDWRLAQAEWQRVQQLGRSAAGDKRFLAAQVAAEQASARLRTLGMSETDIESLAKRKASRLGEYQLQAPQAGVVLSDAFRQGQQVEPGQSLVKLADESNLWVEARLPPELGQPIAAGSSARVEVNGRSFSAQVIQDAHAIDERTRTRLVRLALPNPQHLLHAGLFADVHFQVESPQPEIAVPESALIRGADGDWQVFIETGSGEFIPREVKRRYSAGPLQVIDGLNPGERVVIRGAFFVASEAAKSGFDPHNH